MRSPPLARSLPLAFALLALPALAPGAAAPGDHVVIPPVALAELPRFPSAQVCEERVAWLEAHRAHTQGVADLFPGRRSEWYEYQRWLNQAIRAWELLHRAQLSHWADDTQPRLDALNDLREVIGLESYYLGRMPFPLFR